MRRMTPVLLFVLALALPASPAPDTFHLIKIREFFPGSTVAPNAQYIVLQMYFPSQNLVSGHAVRIFDSLGGLITSFTFPGNVSNGANQATILIATTEAETFFGVTANLNMTPVIPLRGGKICFDITNIDCVSWGNYTGSAVGTGTPFNSPYPLPLGKAVKRDLRGNGTLEAGDDSNDSETDFFFGLPAPRNNAGISGTIPPSTCGNGTLEGLEQCDDGNTTAGDGCDALCADEPICGNGIPEPGEECDDGNTTSGDGCDALCASEPICGNGILEAGEECDDGNTTSGDGCDALCASEPICGNGILEAGEECDDGNTTSGDGCDALCANEGVCGNGAIEPGEGCDDGNTDSGDGCSATCQIEGECAVLTTGDVNVSGTITSADIIGLVNFVFKGGATPQPCEGAGDVNCSGTVTSADIIGLVNFVFKGGAPPCDVCALVPGTWSC